MHGKGMEKSRVPSTIDLCASHDTPIPAIPKERERERERVEVLVHFGEFVLSSFGSYVLCEHA